MDGYAVYVWPSFAIAAFVLIGLAVWSVGGLRASKKQLELLQPLVDARREARRAGAARNEGQSSDITEKTTQ